MITEQVEGTTDADGTESGWDDSAVAKAIAGLGSGDSTPEAAAAVGVAVDAIPSVEAAPNIVVLDEGRPYGRLVGAAPAHFIQDGLTFGVDKVQLGFAQEL